MLKAKVIGTGAAGNKAVLELVTSHGFDPKDVTLINSTDSDIPKEYRDGAIIFGKSNAKYLGGCGKERSLGNRLFLNDLENGKIDLKSIVDDDTNFVIIVSSTEGGTGSSTSPIIARYIRDYLRIPVVMVLFFGFNTDARGMQNSIEICQELSSDYTVIGISNAKFLDNVDNNKIRAERLANTEFCEIVKILSGYGMEPGAQNIDNTDLCKLVTTPGYMCLGTASIKNAKNPSMINNTIKAAIDDSKFVDPSDKSAKRIGVIFNITEDMEDNIDINGAEFVKAYGSPYEMFTHIQYTKNTSIKWIAAGMNLPIDAIKEIYEAFKEASSAVHKEPDSFFNFVSDLRGGSEHRSFDMGMSMFGEPDDKKDNSDIKNFFDTFGKSPFANV